MARRTTLARGATGLPRYYMDVHWWTGPAWLGATPAEVGLRDAMSSYCARHNTEGRVPADPKALAIALGFDSTDVRKPLKAILARRKPDGTPVLAHDGDQLVIAGYVDHNPTKAEVEAHQAERSESGRKGNHQRHHVDKGVVKPGCEWCDAGPNDEGTRQRRPSHDENPSRIGENADSDTTVERSSNHQSVTPPQTGPGGPSPGHSPPGDRYSDRSANRSGIATSSHGIGSDRIGSDGNPGQSSSETHPGGHPQPVDNDDDDREPPPIHDQAYAIIAARRAQDAGGKPNAWRNAVARNLPTDEHHPGPDGPITYATQATWLLNTFRITSAAELADALTGRRRTNTLDRRDPGAA